LHEKKQRKTDAPRLETMLPLRAAVRASAADTCTTLSLDGSQVPDPGAIIGETITGKTVTCGEVKEQDALGVQDQETCNSYALMGVYTWVCKNTLAEQSCQLC
jgi:hypothetical protein